MSKFLLKRIVSLIPVVIIISVMLFTMFRMMPGDPIRAMMPTYIKDPNDYKIMYQQLYEKFGFDKNIVEQYFRWFANMLQGDFGFSTNYTDTVVNVIQKPLQNSISLNLVSIAISFIIAIPVGIRSAMRKGGAFDSFWQVFSLVGLSIPTFFIGLTLIYFFAITFKLLPSGGMSSMSSSFSLSYFLQWLRYATLPMITITIGSLAGTIRYVRNAMIEVLSKDYIRTARSKGLSEKVIVYSHAFRNALIPVVTLVAGSLISVFGGSAITESIFAYNGIGQVLISSLNARDYAVVLALNMFYAVISLVANVLMDIGYAIVDPRIKLD